MIHLLKETIGTLCIFLQRIFAMMMHVMMAAAMTADIS